MAKKKEEEKAVEREFVISFSRLFNQPRVKRARRAMTDIRRFMFKHFRAKAEDVSISNALNEAIWERGREHIPRRIEVKAVKEEGKVHVYLKGEKIEKPRKKEEKKEAEKPGKETKEEKEEKEEAERKRDEKKAKEKAADAAAIKRGTAKEGE